jgi:hypothetical protein
MSCLDQALTYAARGWRVFPCRARDKRPLVTAWQNAATTDEEQIAQWWTRWPDANLAVVLGQASGLIDLETDCAEEEQDLLRLFGGDLPVCPSFKSSRGRHWLFQWHEHVPPQAVVKYGRLGVRTGGGGKGAYSIFPPSVHPSGERYEWLPGLGPDEVNLPALPTDAITRLWNEQGEDAPPAGKPGNGKPGKTPEEWEKIASGGLPEGERNTALAELCGKLFGKGNVLDNSWVSAQWQLVKAWNATNRPPMPDQELASTFKSILANEKQKREAAKHEAEKSGTKGEASGEWRVEVCDSEPPEFWLYGPRWSEQVKLSAEQYLNAFAVMVAALKQKSVPLPPAFKKFWNGDKESPAMYVLLMENARHVKAPAEVKRNIVVLELLYEQIAKARTVDGEQEPDFHGRPCKLVDGSVVFKFAYVWEPMNKGADQVKRTELSDALRTLGAQDTWVGKRGGSTMFKRLDPAALAKLYVMVSDGKAAAKDTKGMLHESHTS